MTHSSDGWGDMRDEQLSDEPLLTDFLAELRSWGTGEAPTPSAHLATLLEADHVAPAAPVEPVPQPIRRKRMFVAKLAGLGVAAKVALGVGVAAAAVTTAGAGGVLPGPAQHGIAVAVNAVSPLDIPDRAKDKAVADEILALDADDDVDVTTTTVALPGIGDPTDDVDGDDDEAGEDETADNETTDNHGACVSAVARDKGLSGREHGQAVSAIAQSDCGKEDETTTSTTTPTSTTTTTTIADGDVGEGEAPSEHSGPGNSGHGNGNGNQRKGAGNS